VAPAAFILAGWFVALAPSGGPARATSTLDAEEQLFVTLINQHRAANSLGALTINTQLQSATAWMSDDMAANNYFSHCDGLGAGPGPAPCPNPCSNTCRGPFVRMSDFGYNFNTWKGENIAAGTASAQVAFDLWKNSPGHNANMLNAEFKVMGITRSYDVSSGFDWYWTNDFGGHDPGPADADGDGFTSLAEQNIGTNPNDPCGNPNNSIAGSPSGSWPADLVTGGASNSANNIDIADLQSFVSPVRRLNSNPGDPAFHIRWDLVPGTVTGKQIDIADMSALFSGPGAHPPMLGGVNAFNGPDCPNP